MANWERQTHLHNVVGMKINTDFPTLNWHRTEQHSPDEGTAQVEDGEQAGEAGGGESMKHKGQAEEVTFRMTRTQPCGTPRAGPGQAAMRKQSREPGAGEAGPGRS